jgi:alkaline phosphatase D
LTSSGLTEVWPVTPPNARRVGDVYRDRNFGLIEIDWSERTAALSVRGEDGAKRLGLTVNFDDLRARG